MSNSLSVIARKLLDDQEQEKANLKEMFKLIAARSESNKDIPSLITDIVFNYSYLMNDLGLLARSEESGSYSVPREEIIEDLRLPTIHLLNVVTFCLKQQSANFDAEIQRVINMTFYSLENYADAIRDEDFDETLYSPKRDKEVFNVLFVSTANCFSRIVNECSKNMNISDIHSFSKFLSLLAIIAKLFEFDLSNAHKSI